MDLQRLKATVDLAALVHQSHPLENGNNRYRRSKEHDSLVVDTQTGQYFWNSRGESGDCFDWAGRYCLGLNGQWSSSDPSLFKEAAKYLAKFAGLPEPQFKPEDSQAREARLTAERLMSMAMEYYHAILNSSIQGYQYATERGFTPETIDRAKLGFSDGSLHQTISQTDSQAAIALGLIWQDDRGRLRDAIPSGYLVYPHISRGRVEYLAGRSIAEKRHMNQRAPKKMYLAGWPGFGPLVICEGQADAISLAQLGVSALALCGVNLSDFDPDYIRLYSPVYIWQDCDPAGSEVAKAWLKRLSDLADSLGPLVRVFTVATANNGEVAGIKDANDFLLTGAGTEDLQALLKTSATFLDTEISRLSLLQGAELYDQLEPLFKRLSNLDIFAINTYRGRVCKELSIGQADFGRFLKAAKGTLSEDEESDFAKGGQYAIHDGWTVHKTHTEDGKPKLQPLANGSAVILEEISIDDGSNEPQLDFLIAGELCTGQKLPKMQVKADEFATMKWVSRWGSRFILSAGRSTQDHFRAAIQYLSKAPYKRTIYSHTGWRHVEGKWLFLTSAGALGSQATDEKIQIDLRLGRPDTHMTRYHLPLAPDGINLSLQASLNFWNIAHPSITVPIWAAMYLAPLSRFLTIDFGLWVHGLTGSLKSSIAAVALAHFGQWQGKDAKSLLPSNFQSTSNNILMNAFQAKDVPLVIDDFAPGATQKEVRERDATASNLLRSIGNRAARGRMRDGRTFQADYPPRCLAIVTAEDLPSTASIMARGIGVRVALPPKSDPSRKPIEARLTQAQTVDSFLYPHAMAAYILWLQRHMEQLEKDLPVMAGTYRDQMNTGHARLPDAFGKLMAAVDTAIFFALDSGAITDSQAREKKAQAGDALGLMIREHGEAVDTVDACQIFRETLVENLDARNWYLCQVQATDTSPPPNSPVGAVCVGYQDDSYIYLLTKTVVEVMQAYQRLGTPFPVGKNTLYKRMTERGWLLPSEKSSTNVYVPALGTSPRVLKFYKRAILEL